MSQHIVLFLHILKAELEDLLEDIELVEKTHKERFSKNEIQQYVYKENEALFEREAESIAGLLEKIDDFEYYDYKTIDELVAAVDAKVKELVKEHEDPGAVYEFVHRKILKVRDYVLLNETAR